VQPVGRRANAALFGDGHEVDEVLELDHGCGDRRDEPPGRADRLADGLRRRHAPFSSYQRLTQSAVHTQVDGSPR
jgi:hypothetical protein